MIPAQLAGKEVRQIYSPSTGISIPVIYGRGMVFSAWQASPEEIQKLKDGFPLWLIQRGTHIPEMTLVVAEKAEIVPRDIIIEAVSRENEDTEEMVRKHKLEIAITRKWGNVLFYVSCLLTVGSVLYGTYRLIAYFVK